LLINVAYWQSAKIQASDNHNRHGYVSNELDYNPVFLSPQKNTEKVAQVIANAIGAEIKQNLQSNEIFLEASG
jgi:hypothetical protein